MKFFTLVDSLLYRIDVVVGNQSKQQSASVAENSRVDEKEENEKFSREIAVGECSCGGHSVVTDTHAKLSEKLSARNVIFLRSIRIYE
jgi:hypothetical protein